MLKGADCSDNYIVNEPEIALFLKRNGVPVTEYVLNKENQYLWNFNGSVYHLQRFVEGEIFAFHKAPDWFMVESAQLLGKIHAVLLEFRRLPIGMGIGFINHMRSDNPKRYPTKEPLKSLEISMMKKLLQMLNTGFLKLISYRISNLIYQNSLAATLMGIIKSARLYVGRVILTPSLTGLVPVYTLYVGR